MALFLPKEGPGSGPLAFPRGTRDLTERAWEARRAEGTIPPLVRGTVRQDLSLRHRVELALREAEMTAPEVARAIRVSVVKVRVVIDELRVDHLVYNLGSADDPRWVLRIGDDASTIELRGMIRRLIRARPMSTREISDATGARVPRVTRALVVIRQEGDPLERKGAMPAARWFLPAP